MERHPLPARAGQSPPRWFDPLGGIVLHLAAGLLAGLLLAAPIGADLEQRIGLQWLYSLRGARPAPQAVAVVAIDGKAAQQLNLSLKPGDWPRGLHARLIDALAAAGARVIVFDLTFVTPSKQPENDTQLAAALRRAGNVILVDALRREVAPVATDAIPAGDSLLVDRPLPPIPAIARAALAHAPFPLPKQGRVDAYWTFVASAGELPSMPVEGLQAGARDTLAMLINRCRPLPATMSATGERMSLAI